MRSGGLIIEIYEIFLSYNCRRSQFAEQKLMRRYLYGSAVGVLFWIVVLTAWQVVYQTNRISWGAVGDYITMSLPRGYD